MEKKLKTGFILIIIQSVLLFAIAVLLLFLPKIIGIDSEHNYFWIGTLVLGVMSVLMFVLGMFARKGKKGAAIAIIAVGAIVWTVSLLAIIGSTLIFSAINPPVGGEAEIQETNTETFSQPVEKEAASADIVAAVDNNTGAEEEVRSEKRGKILGKISYVKSKLGKDERGSAIKAFVTLTIFYIVVLALALTSYFTYFFGAFNGSSLCRAISSMIIAFTPAYLVYFGADNPFKFKKIVSALLIILGVLGFVGCDALMILCSVKSGAELQNFTIMLFVVCAIIAQIAIIFCFTYLFTDLPCGMYIAFCICGPAFLTFLSALVIAIVIIAAIVVCAIKTISMLVFLMSDDKGVKAFKQAIKGESPEMKQYTFTNEMGSSQTVFSSDGKNFTIPTAVMRERATMAAKL